MTLSFFIMKGEMDNDLVKKMLAHYKDGLLSPEEFIAFVEGLSDNPEDSSAYDNSRD